MGHHNARVEWHRGDAKFTDNRYSKTVTLRPVVNFGGYQPSQEETRALHHEAHDACSLSNSVHTEIRVESV